MIGKRSAPYVWVFMEKLDESGIIIRADTFGNEYIVDILTMSHGRWRGLCNARHRPTIGAQVAVKWRCRSTAGIGKLSIEMTKPSPAITMWNSPMRLLTFSSLCETASKFLPERSPDYNDFQVFTKLVYSITDENFISRLMEWERYLLRSHFGEVIDEFQPDINGLLVHMARTRQIGSKSRTSLIVISRRNAHKFLHIVNS